MEDNKLLYYDKERFQDPFARSSMVEPIIPNHQRISENAKESQILLWIWNLLEEVSPSDYEQYLRDGVILCRLMNRIKPGIIPGDIIRGDNLKEKKRNLEKFLKAALDYGVSNDSLFDPNDLLLLQNIPRVTACLYELGKAVENDSNFDGPTLGELPYEPIDPKTKRRAGLPEGDDIHVAHVDIKMLKKMMSIEV